MKQSISKFSANLNMAPLFNNFIDYKNEISAVDCKKNLDLIVLNTIDTAHNTIINVLQNVVNKVNCIMN